MRGAFPLAMAGLLAAFGCGTSSSDFPVSAARAHVAHLSATIGSRPLGTAANRRAREYLVDTLARAGFSVRIQDTQATSARYDVTGRVHNIIAVADGPQRDAVGLIAHYDSVPEGRGAVDDAFGTAVVVEAARVLARRPDRRWSLVVMLTDGEEEGLLGASALVDDAEVRERVKAVINVEAMGGDRPVLLFETGPGNDWLTKVWAAAAPHPRGASFNYEIYRRMPNDTDFSVFRRIGVPGLNLSASGDTYSYHTALESPARVTDAALAQGGSTVVAVVDALQREDINRRSSEDATYFDLLGSAALAWSARTDIALLGCALVLGLIALLRSVIAVARAGGPIALLLTASWPVVGVAAVAGAAVGSVALQRAVREVYHPWHADPGRFALMILLAGAAAGWLVGRLAVHLPPRLRLPRHAAVALAPTLLVWIVLAGVAGVTIPRASYLWVLPLLALALPIAIGGAATASTIVGATATLAVSSLLWLPDTAMLVRFIVPLAGGLPLVTPIWVLPAILLLAALMVMPPLLALAVASRLPRPRFATRALLVSAGLSVGWAYQAPAYTTERPLRLVLISVSGEGGRAQTVTMIAGNEPAPVLGASGPRLTPVAAVPRQYTRYVGRAPFVAMAPPGPMRQSAQVTCQVDGDTATIVVVPNSEGTRVRLELPRGVVPNTSTPPGSIRESVWGATVVGVAETGVVFRLGLPAGMADRACDGQALVRLPRPIDPVTGAAPDWLAQPGIAWDFLVVDRLPLR